MGSRIGGNDIELTELLDRLSVIQKLSELDALRVEIGRIVASDTSGAGFYRVQNAIAKAKVRLGASVI